ncbi:MAG: hypothetical protein QF649_03945, partial [SAR324 cluster bacterium]|nr:hypothetical protein [SAR324 cluster bacterium]
MQERKHNSTGGKNLQAFKKRSRCENSKLNRNKNDKLRREFEEFRERSDIKLWLKDAALFDVIEKIPELRGVDW